MQIHLGALYALKHDLHVLYAGARILGAMDDLTIKWEGKLLKEVSAHLGPMRPHLGPIRPHIRWFRFAFVSTSPGAML